VHLVGTGVKTVQAGIKLNGMVDGLLAKQRGSLMISPLLPP
jgi:hypothetical protein